MRVMYRFYDFLLWMKERGKIVKLEESVVEVHILLFSDLAIIALYWAESKIFPVKNKWILTAHRKNFDKTLFL